MTTRIGAPLVALGLMLACGAEPSEGAPPPGSGGTNDAPATTGQMTAVASFGSNPGALGMYEYVPVDLPDQAPLVLVLHGCTQTAADMQSSGWSELADEYGFALVYPEQSTSNNSVRCFNWAGEYGDPANLVRGQGENQSMKSMVDWMIANRGVDPARVYIAGFSAGGAFAAVMLATWPDVFAAGAVQSGVPYRCATTVQGAYDCQSLNNHPERKKEPAEWGDLVRAAYPGYTGPYPRVSIWHGLNDTFIVHHENRTELLEQWTNVHAMAMTPTSTEMVAGHEHAVYRAGERAMVESYAIAGMGHAVAFGLADPDHPCGPSGFAQYYEDRGICASFRIAEFFGLTGPSTTNPPCAGEDCTDPPVGGTPPTVDITSPSGGSTVSGTATVSVTAGDDTGIDRVELYVDGAMQAADRQAPWAFDWQTAAFSDGPHTLMAIAYDTDGNIAVDDDTTVIVDNGGGGGAGAQPSDFGGCDASGSAAGWILLLAAGLLVLRRRHPRRRRWRPSATPG
ncbi:MAG TPA: PHB depolymerase family esterase [Kofleriaceae bacterium]|nr:PHB depolymerase family esterase [Kofleriaceae bacterium]